MKNRRNYYRLLQVQPEAPAEIIKASYRALMTKLRLHPDLGGDTETAALINQAYAVLIDPEKRRQYDLTLRQRHQHPSAHASGSRTHARDNLSSVGRPAGGTDGVAPSTRMRPEHPAASSCCMFCNASLNGRVDTTTRCHHCHSPVFPVSRMTKTGAEELFGRRSIPRATRNETVLLYPVWPHQGVPARLRDLSPLGVSFVTELNVQQAQVLKISSCKFEGVARVVSVRHHGGSNSVHASLVAVMFNTKMGSFVSLKA